MARREERAVTIPLIGGEAAGLALDGLYVAPDPALDAPGGAVIAPPHPLYGGSMDSPVVAELSWAIARTGLATLRFDWRGVGASAGAPSGELDDAAVDYGGALAQLGESVAGPLVAAGYSFGAAAAVRAASQDPRVASLVLVAPPPSMLDREALAARAFDVLILAGEHDRIAPVAALEAIAASLRRARFVRIDEADHFFGAGLSDLGKAVTRFTAGEA
jgi:alpha/beta superfamily hydrolase